VLYSGIDHKNTTTGTPGPRLVGSFCVARARRLVVSQAFLTSKLSTMVKYRNYDANALEQAVQEYTLNVKKGITKK
jgi:hypothetical protein